ncbi:MAG: DNA replication and repair protein RecF, partial [Actinomycetota bacterium]|nr:DNA replication and repair protein RecF [Actinomycetota bacterium]
MHLAWVELRGFRNHEHTDLRPLVEGLTVVVGPNGEGKTNLLEGMYVLYALGSPRASSNAALVREGDEAAYARGEFRTANGNVLVEVEIPVKGASRVKVDRSPVRRKRDLRRQVRAVLFGPFDLPIVIGDPSKRRAFLDEAVSALWPLKEGLFTAYDRVLRQRNRLLKEWDRPGMPAGIEAWDEELVQAGSALARARHEAVECLGPHAAAEFAHLAGYGVEVRYRPNVWDGDDLETAFSARIDERRADELARRTSLVGPHRDDLSLEVRELGARSAGSHGETWATALCLRVGLAAAVEHELGEPPVLLVDDPLSALDPGRRDRFLERLSGRAGQVFVSVADEADVPGQAHAVWDVRAGTV